MKHYNSGHVWGRVVNAEEKSGKVREGNKRKTGTPYLSLEIQCPNDVYGDITTFGRIWGRKKIDEFLALYRRDTAAAYHLQGFFSQYTREAKVLSNYTVFKFSTSAQSDFRAAFILVGEVLSTGCEEEMGVINLHVLREGSEGYEDMEEEFKVYTLNAQEVHGLNQGDALKVKGVLRYPEELDHYGDNTGGTVRPYVMEMQTIEKEEAF